MCGVVGYVGKSLSKGFVLKGLERLEYRGYDSAGFACLEPGSNALTYVKTKGHLENLVQGLQDNPIDGYVGIGHTRWSTHGVVSQENAHPHVDCKGTLSVVHNGIIENHYALAQTLRSLGHEFVSQTDTEVIAHLLENVLLDTTFLHEAISITVQQLHGAYAFACISKRHPDSIIAVRKGSPMCLGIGNKEMFVASDPLAFAGLTDRVVFLPDESFAILTHGTLALYDFDGNVIQPQEQHFPYVWSDDGKNGYEHYMLKEIFEQKHAIQATISDLQATSNETFARMGLPSEFIRDMRSLTMIGCGSSWHAGRIGQFFIEQACQMPARVVLASEYRYMPFFGESTSAYVAISQSGETADTLEVLRLINGKKFNTVALTNVPSSTMAREAKGYVLTKAGQEISVASTKAFTTQVAALYWLAHRIALEKGLITKMGMQKSVDDLLIAAEALENCIERYRVVIHQTLAPFYAQFKKFIFLGRHASYPFAMEAALKLKEISYIFAQCYPAGELKHGPIALIDEETPIILFSSLDPLIYQKLLSNAQEIRARNGHLIVFAFDGQDELCNLAQCVFKVPQVQPLLGPLAMTGLMQFFVYHIARVLGRPIDKPRNLAKSVTVE
jgi:glucosamine--fructose-6-phosphate aminotransferase (isomerizing)